VIIDLHTHSDASDGELAPNALLRHAAAHGVEFLSITDHDTTAAYESLDTESVPLRVIPGVEFSTRWNGAGIHVIGLGIDVTAQRLVDGLRCQQEARRERAQTIAARLRKRGVRCVLDDVVARARKGIVGRPHFADYLVDTGAVADTREAFRKYLGPGRIGDVKTGWAPLQPVVDWIVAAGGVAVLAHPARYNMTTTRLRCLLADFRKAGGRAIEVVSGSQSPNTTANLARLASDFELLASAGSEFHRTGLAWSAPGRFAPMPDTLPKVWDAWRNRCA